MKPHLLHSTLPGLSTPPSPTPSPTPVTFAEDTAPAFLQDWTTGDYLAMYALLAPDHPATLTAEEFAARYTIIATEATLKSVQASLVSFQEEGDDAIVEFTATFTTNAVGTIQQDNVMRLHRQDNR